MTFLICLDLLELRHACNTDTSDGPSHRTGYGWAALPVRATSKQATALNRHNAVLSGNLNRSGEIRNIFTAVLLRLPPPGIERILDSPARSLVTIPTELSRHLLNSKDILQTLTVAQ